MTHENNISQEEFERFERHFLGKMAEEELVAFEEQLNTDPELKSRYEETISLMQGVEEMELRSFLKEVHKKMDKISDSETKKSKSRWLGLPMSGLAATLLLIGLIGGFWMLSGIFKDADLFDRYYAADPGLATTMSSEADYPFDRGMVDYKSGEFRAAIKRWETLGEEGSRSDTLKYFLGSAHLALRESKLATYYLEPVAANSESVFRSDAAWYLALSYLLEANVERAKQLLEKTEHPQAEELLQKLTEK